MTSPRCVALLAGGVLVLAGYAGATNGRSTDRGAVPVALAAAARPIAAGNPLGARERPLTPRPCRRTLGRRFAAHVEVFADDRVVLVPAGIGAGRPLRRSLGRIERARCYGPLVTLDPTGVVLVTAGARATLGDLIATWGVPLGPRSAAGRALRTPRGWRAYVDGRRQMRDPLAIPLTRHAEIVLELGPFVAPHASYRFPRGL